MVTEIRAVSICRPNCVSFVCGVGWRAKFYRRRIDIPDELFARILSAAARIKHREDQLIRKARNLRTRVAECIQFDVGIFELLL
jgi:hypothetical protein